MPRLRPAISLLAFSAFLCAPCSSFGQDVRFDARPQFAATSDFSALSVGDLDGDGDPDIAAVDAAGGRLVWLENNSDVDPTFRIEHTVSSSIVSPQAVRVGDIDGDGDLDIAAVGSATSGDVVWFENQGGLPPVFAERLVGPRPAAETTGVVRAVAVTDVDGDGDLDIACGFQLPQATAAGHVTVYVNDGDPLPGFTPVSLSSPPQTLFEITGLEAGDVNLDNAPDFVASSRRPGATATSDSVVLWQNDGAAIPSFTRSVIATELDEPADIALALITSDSLPEIIVAQEASDRVTVFRNIANTPGSFTPLQSIPAQGVVDIDTGDLSTSGMTDIVAATTNGPLLIENLGGAGPTLAPLPLPSPDGSTSTAAVGALDSDTDLDVVLSGPAGTRWLERVEPLVNTTTGAFFRSIDEAVTSVSTNDTLVAAPEHFVPDAIVPSAPSPYRLESTGALHLGARSLFETSSDVTLASQPGQQLTIDGTLSLAPGRTLTLESTDSVRIRSSQTIEQAEVEAPGSVLAVDLCPDLLIEEVDGAFAPAPTGLSSQPRDAKFFAPSTIGPQAIATVSNEIGGGATSSPGGLLVYVPSTSLPGSWNAVEVDGGQAGRHRSLATGDLNRDGVDDLATVFVPANGNPAQLRLHLSDGGTPPAFSTITVGLSQASGGHQIFDLNRDGLADVITPEGYYAQSAGLTFSFVPFPLVNGDRGLSVAVAQLNADFEPDVVVHTATLSGPLQRATGFRLVALVADGLGGFNPTVVDSLDRSSDPTCEGDCYPSLNTDVRNLNTLTVADLDHDMDDDIVLSEDQGLALYETSPGGASLEVLLPGLPWSESVAIDLNEDGHLDLAVAHTSGSAVVGIDAPLAGTGLIKEIARPVERVASIDAGDLDGDDDQDLVFAGSAFDRVTIVRRDTDPSINLLGSNASLQSPDELVVTRGTIDLQGATLESGGSIAIEVAGKVVGAGQLAGAVFNGGLIAPRPLLDVVGNYVQFSIEDPDIRGSLDVLLTTLPDAALTIQGVASLAGDLRVDAESTVTLGPLPRQLVRAQSLGVGLSEFDSTLVPRLPVDLGNGVESGVGIVLYDTTPTESVVLLAPQPFTDPELLSTSFPSLGRPADATLADVVGGPNGGPDGVPDLIIAYPSVSVSQSGTIALLAGEMTKGGCRFRSVGIYTGKNADAPVAVEVADFDGDGLPEIAFGNRGDSRSSNLVHFLIANDQASEPLVDSSIPPVPLAGDRTITDLATITLDDPQGPNRTSGRSTLLILSGGGLSGTATASTYDPGIDDWEVCDIDVCDDPDSFDPIDPDGASAALGEGFASTSTSDDKATVASNTGGMPDSFPRTSYALGSDPTEIRAADLNNDGFPDIAAINETGGSVSVLINEPDGDEPGGRGFGAAAEWTLRSDPADPDPLPSSIALADLDDDGDLDIAVVSTDSTGTRSVRSLTNLYEETGAVSFTLPENLPEQPADTPLLVREFDASLEGATVLADDLVVLTEPSVDSRSRRAIGSGPNHALLCSEAQICLPDVNGDGLLTPADFNAWILAYNTGAPQADQNGDGIISPADFNAWIFNYNAGC